MKLFPDWYFTIKGRYILRVGRLEIFPVPYRSTEEDLTIPLVFSCRFFSLSFGWDYSVDLDRFNEMTGKERFWGEVSLCAGEILEIECAPSFKRLTDAESVWELPLHASFNTGCVELDLSGKLTFCGNRKIESALRVEYNGERGGFFVKLTFEMLFGRPVKLDFHHFQEYLGIQIGWEARERFPTGKPEGDSTVRPIFSGSREGIFHSSGD